MSEVSEFGLIVLVVAGALSLAIALSKLTERFPVPGPAFFLLLAAIASDIFPGLSAVSIQTVERIGVVALIVILCDGGMHVGWRRFRASAVPIASLGTLGTFATASVIALFAHVFLGFGWTEAGIVGAALAPTDPAVMFSVLGKREVGGRSGTILEGESGANDPVGIALMIGMLELATHPDASFVIVIEEFLVEMAIGLMVGVAGAFVLLPLMRRLTLPSEALYPIRTLAFAGVIYGAAAVAHGSGFLAVFVAGLLIGDERAPYKGEIERFHMSLASLAEIAVFTVLGLTVDITDLGRESIWLDGLLLALILAFVARPVVVGLLLLPTRLHRGEKLFVMWGGLKGAVPILLGTFALLEGVDEAERIYGIVFVVVAFSVIVQGTSIPFVAPRLEVPMRVAEPRGIQRCTVHPGSRAAGEAISNLPLGERTWIDAVVREGRPLPVHGDLVLREGDEVALITDVEDAVRLAKIFERY
ncbi:MAG: sodium:proton exchanger [Thermoleophilia bacterium]